MMNTDKLIAALTDAIEARKASIPRPTEENNERYRKCSEEVEYELKAFIKARKSPRTTLLKNGQVYLESVRKTSDQPKRRRGKQIHPEPPALSEEEIEAVLRERMKTFERDKEDALPWEQVKARILSSHA